MATATSFEEENVCTECGRHGRGPNNPTGPVSFLSGVCNICRSASSSQGKATNWRTTSAEAGCLGCKWEDDAGGWPRAVSKEAADHHKQTGHGVRIIRTQDRRTAGS